MKTMVNSRRGDIAAGKMTGIATLPQVPGAAAPAKSRRWRYGEPLFPGAAIENLQAAARHVPCIHFMFIKVTIVPVRVMLFGGKVS